MLACTHYLLTQYTNLLTTLYTTYQVLYTYLITAYHLCCGHTTQTSNLTPAHWFQWLGAVFEAGRPVWATSFIFY